MSHLDINPFELVGKFMTGFIHDHTGNKDVCTSQIIAFRPYLNLIYVRSNDDSGESLTEVQLLHILNMRDPDEEYIEPLIIEDKLKAVDKYMVVPLRAVMALVSENVCVIW